MNKKLTPLQQLRRDKREIRQKYRVEEDRLQQNWEYLSHNMGSLFFNSTLNSVKGLIGSKKEPAETSFDGGGTESNLMNSFTSALPIMWEIAQPMLIGVVVNKVKNLFRSKKK